MKNIWRHLSRVWLVCLSARVCLMAIQKAHLRGDRGRAFRLGFGRFLGGLFRARAFGATLFGGRRGAQNGVGRLEQTRRRLSFAVGADTGAGR